MKDILFFFWRISCDIWYLWIFPVVLQIYKDIQSPASHKLACFMDTESYSVFIFSEILNLIIGLTCFLKLVVGTLTPFFQLLSFFVYLLSVCIFHPFLASWCFTKIYRNSSYGIKYNTSCLKCIIKYFTNLYHPFNSVQPKFGRKIFNHIWPSFPLYSSLLLL